MCGVMRGSKHWPKSTHTQLWTWVEERLQQIFDRIKPDTLRIWEGMLTVRYHPLHPMAFLTRIQTQITKRDPRRHPGLVDLLKSFPVDFDNESAFYGKWQ